jgi:hypothetical protein
MSVTGAVLLVAWRAVLFVALGWLVLRTYRLAQSRSSVLGAIVAAGLLVRTVLGVALFAISFYGLPIFRSMQLGGGFWTLALDARTYFHLATAATAAGLSSVQAGSPSPGYVRALTVWLDLFGVSPASGILLNFGCYVLVALIILRASSSVTMATIALSAVTFSPALIIFGTQVLKDSVCVLLVVLAFAGAQRWAQATGDGRSPMASGIAGIAGLSAAVFGFAAIRAYFALFIVLSVAAMALASLWAAARRVEYLKALAGYSALLFLLWGVFMMGAGAYYDYYGGVVRKVLHRPLQPTVELDQARVGFIATGGATSVVDTQYDDVPPLGDSFQTASREGVVARVQRTIRGCAVLFVPISILRTASLVTFSGGRGLLVITDIDTLLMDVWIVGSFWFLFRRGLVRSSVPVAIFALALATVTTFSMAYVVTNFGTLFRLRLLAVTPIWLLPAFVTVRGRVASTRPSLT